MTVGWTDGSVTNWMNPCFEVKSSCMSMSKLLFEIVWFIMWKIRRSCLSLSTWQSQSVCSKSPIRHTIRFYCQTNGSKDNQICIFQITYVLAYRFVDFISRGLAWAEDWVWLSQRTEGRFEICLYFSFAGGSDRRERGEGRLYRRHNFLIWINYEWLPSGSYVRILFPIIYRIFSGRRQIIPNKLSCLRWIWAIPGRQPDRK